MLLMTVYEPLKVVQVLQELEASRGRRTALLYRSIWEVHHPVCPQQPHRSPPPSHVAQVMRRLRRICAAVGSQSTKQAP